MTELIAWAPDAATFLEAAKFTKFTAKDQDDKEVILQTGTWSDRDGSWFLNIVGTSYDIDVTDPENPVVTPRPGFWARLRWNGDPTGRLSPFKQAVKSKGVTVYEQQEDGTWSADGGVTTAEKFISDIGLMI